MGFRPTDVALSALVALALSASVGPKSTTATRLSELSASLAFSSPSLASLAALARSLEGKQGYGLSEHLDDVALSQEFQQILTDARVQLTTLEHGELIQVTAAYELDDLFGPVKNRRLLPLAARTFAALVAIFELLSEELLDHIHIGFDQFEGGGKSMAALLDDRETPAAVRRHLRHILRGGVALLCLPMVADDEAQRQSLFTHAAIGMETNLRCLVSFCAHNPRAAEVLRELRLEPIDVDALWQRQAQLAEARQLLQEMQQEVPGFRLPPDPGLTDT